MPNRLSRGGDEIDIIILQSRLGDELVRRVRKELAENEIEMTDFLDRPESGVLASLGIGQLPIALALEQQFDPRLNLVRKLEAGEAELLDARAIARVPFDAHEHGVDCVDRSAGHETDHDSLFLPRDLDESLDAVHVSSALRR